MVKWNRSLISAGGSLARSIQIRARRTRVHPRSLTILRILDQKESASSDEYLPVLPKGWHLGSHLKDDVCYQAVRQLVRAAVQPHVGAYGKWREEDAWEDAEVEEVV